MTDTAPTDPAPPSMRFMHVYTRDDASMFPTDRLICFMPKSGSPPFSPAELRVFETAFSDTDGEDWVLGVITSPDVVVVRARSQVNDSYCAYSIGLLTGFYAEMQPDNFKWVMRSRIAEAASAPKFLVVPVHHRILATPHGDTTTVVELVLLQAALELGLRGTQVLSNLAPTDQVRLTNLRLAASASSVTLEADVTLRNPNPDSDQHAAGLVLVESLRQLAHRHGRVLLPYWADATLMR